jgi:hypothetical protein
LDLLQLGETGNVPVGTIFSSLSVTVVLPILLGQALRYQAWDRIRVYDIPFGNVSSVMLLLIIYAAFCDTFSRTRAATRPAGTDQKGLTFSGWRRGRGCGSHQRGGGRGFGGGFAVRGDGGALPGHHSGGVFPARRHLHPLLRHAQVAHSGWVGGAARAVSMWEAHPRARQAFP